MNIGFYAPLKSPDSEIPSGDRKMAKLLLKCLQCQGHNIRVMSHFKSRESQGIREIQKDLKIQGEQISGKLIEDFSNIKNWQPDLWFTYHMFYKAPDLIGPKVSSTLKIPYVLAEASHAPKRADGPWSIFHNEVEKALAHADLIIGINSNDRASVKQVIGINTRYEELKPFLEINKMMNREEERLLNRHALYDKYKIPLHSVLLLSVGMMREGAKFESYKILANALARMDTKKEWNLVIIGDGPLRSKVESLFNKKIIFAGQLTSTQLQKYYSSADIFLWPAVNEAYGMALLEAQSAGVPAVAGDSGGVKDILRDKKTGLLSIEGDADDFANKTCKLINNTNFRKKLSYNALRITSRDHSFESNSKKIGTWVLETREYFKRL
jgi:glycosyltransferase involved in cell wall biosynthesis